MSAHKRHPLANPPFPLLLLATLMLSLPLARAQDNQANTAIEGETDLEMEFEYETRNCISTRSIRRIRIIDDKSVLIYMSAKRIYHNVLRNVCSGLKRKGTFSYNSSDGQMCAGDGIASMQGAWDDIRPIPRCWLGVHRRVSKEEADALRDPRANLPTITTRPIPLPEVEEVGVETEEPVMEEEEMPEELSEIIINQII